MILIDTGYFVGLISRDDHLHIRASRWANVITEPLLVTEYVLLETLNHFSATALRTTVHELLDFLEADARYEVVASDTALFRAGRDLHRLRPDKHWSLTDCVSFIVMQQRGITRALAYDRHFEQAGFEPLLRRDPN